MRGKYMAVAAICLAVISRVVVADGVDLAKTDMTTVKTVSLGAADWHYVPKGGEGKLTTGTVALPGDDTIGGFGRGNFHSVIGGGVGHVVLQYATGAEDRDGKHLEQWGVTNADLATGTSSGITLLPANYLAKAASADGSRVAVSGKNGENNSIVQIVDIGARQAAVKLAFMPYEGDNQDQRVVNWVRFVDQDHFLTENNGRHVVMWQMTANAAKAIWSLELTGQSIDPVSTADGKALVLIDDKGTYLIDALTGAISGTIEDPITVSAFASSGLKAAVSDDGKVLARATSLRVRFFNLAGEPKLLSDVFMPPKIKVDSMNWVSDNYLLINRTWLVDVQKGLIVWKYSGLGGGGFDNSSSVLFGGDSRLWYVSNANNKPTIRSYVVPDDDLKKTVAALNLDTLMAVKPGMTVSLQVEIPEEQVAADIRSHFEAELAKSKMTIADGQPLKLHVTISNLNPRDVQYRNPAAPPVGRGARDSNATVTVRQMTVAYELDGTVIWNVTLFSGPPLIVRVAPGQSVEGAIRAKQAGDWAQLDAVELPKYVPALRDPPGFGQTALDVVRH